MPLLSVGSSGTQVSELQRRLKAAGFSPGNVDGVFGGDTRAAVLRFQRANGLAVDGKVGADTTAVLNRARFADSFEPVTAPSLTPSPVTPGADRTAVIDQVSGRGTRTQLVSGRITVNGSTYQFRSGGHGRGSLPTGAYEITPHLWSRSTRSMNVGGVGYSFAMSDKYDPRVGGTRRHLRIHPDGLSAGTEGCVGIVGDAATQRRFREDMRAELERSGGRFTLHVG